MMALRASTRWPVAAAIAAALPLLAVLWTATNHRAHADERSETALDQPYDSPLEVVFSPDGARLYVLCQQSDEVRVLNASTYAQIAAIPVGHVPRGMALSADGVRLFVTNSWDDTLSTIDTRKLAVSATFQVGAEPSGVVADRAGKFLFVANRISNDVAVLDARTGVEQKRLLGGRGTSYLTLSTDGTRVYATHIYPNSGPHRTAPESEITVIDAARAVVVERIPLHGLAGLFHLAVSADGSMGAVAGYHPKNLIPIAHVEHGGYLTYSLVLFGAAIGAPVEIPLDELERYSSQPFAVAFAPDNSRIYVTAGGSECVVVLDVARLRRFLRTHPRPAPGSYASDLSASANYIVARIPVGNNPRGLALSRDGSRLLVANRLDDSLSAIDTRGNRVVKTIPIGGVKPVSAKRRGEQTFYTSRYSFQGQIGCSSCHIDSTFDALTWNLEPSGFGRDIVSNRLIEDLKGTEPFKWNGGNPDIPTECGPRTEKYFWRSEQYGDHRLADLSMYLRTLPARPNRWRTPGAMTPSVERGKALFERSVDRFGKPIAEANRCNYCHSGLKGTSQRSFDVGTRKPTDNTGLYDTPQLTNIALHAPYLHDGSARTLEEIWTVFNPGDKHGRTNDLTKDELNDLIEYLRTR
jgi:YVTN family beta-propeller protein